VYPRYVQLLRLLASIILPIVAALVALASGLAGNPPWEVVLDAAGATLATGVQLAFWVTLVFALLERSGVTLPPPAASPTPAPARVGAGETIGSIAVQVVLLGVVLWPWQYWPSPTADPVRVLNAEIATAVTVALVGILLAGIAHAAAVQVVGRWTVPLAVVNTVLDAAFAGIVIWLVAQGLLFDAAFEAAVAASPTLDAGTAADVVRILATLVGWSVGVACAIDAVDGWRKALRQR
jgi:hypothetical protein